MGRLENKGLRDVGRAIQSPDARAKLPCKYREDTSRFDGRTVIVFTPLPASATRAGWMSFWCRSVRPLSATIVMSDAQSV